MKRLLMALVIIQGLMSVLLADTNVPAGTINVNTAWTFTGSPYIIQGAVTIASGVTLTVDSGVVVKFAGNYSLTMNGNLIADGTPANRITFTTNNSTPAPGQWGKLIFNSGTNSLLDNCDVRYGGSSSSNLVELNGGVVQISACNVTNSQQYGIGLQGGSALISGTAISNCPCAFYQNSWNGTVSFGAGNSFTGNTRNTVHLATPLEVAGNDTLPNLGIPYYVVNSLRVDSGRSLTIMPGCILKFGNGGYLNVYGTLLAVGGSAAVDNIYFTDYRDDVWGSDSNGDGIATGPGVNWWYGISFFSGSSSSSRVDNCKIRYTGYAAGSSPGQYGGCVNIFNCGPKIKRNFFSTSYFGIRIEGVTDTAEVDLNDFGIATSTPVALGFEAFPSFENNTFSSSNNGYDAIGILSGTLTASATLPQRNVTAIPNVTYVMLGSVTVPPTMSLTIPPGVVIKWLGDYQLDVQGTLIANGVSPDSVIVFTSVRDDNWGNPPDTQNDGSGTAPASGDWGRIWFEDSSNDATCILNYCRVLYGGCQGTNKRANVQTSFASPTITHCDFANTTRALTLFGNSNPNLQFNTYTNTQFEPVELSAAANPTFGSETMTNVGYRALGILPETLPGNGSIIVRNFAGYSNITYVLSGALTVPTGAILTISPTVVIKGTSPCGYSSCGSLIDVNGTLNATGSAGNPIVFTSVKDDIYGNPQDTNGDGSSTQPARNDWGGIFFEDISVDAACVMDYCIVKYGREGVDSRSAGPLINHCTISDNAYGIYVEGNGNPRVWNTAINNAQYTPIDMSLTSDPDFQNITFAGNALNGLGIVEGTLTGTGHLKRRDVAGITSIAYVSLNSVNIATNGDLIIDPGVVIKMDLPVFPIGWSIDGKIHAMGKSNPDSSIVWTSISDDSRGGDTNNNGNGTQPAIGNWSSIVVNDAANDTACVFRYCKFYYGNSGGNWGEYNQYGALTCFNSSPMIQNCEFAFHRYAVGIFGSSAPASSNNLFQNITYSPILTDLVANPTFSGDAMFNIGLASISLRTQSVTIDATWPQRNFAGYNNITYTIVGPLTVASGATLTIPAGTVIKSMSGCYLDVNGSLRVNGAAGNRVVFTSTRDDSYGNPMDTNQDGATTTPHSGDWGGVYFRDISVDANSYVNYAQLNYSSDGLNWETAAAPCTETNFFGNRWGVNLGGASSPTITNFNISGSQFAPIIMSLASNPTFVGGTLTNNAFQAIQLVGETTSADYTIPRRDVAGDVNIVYLLYQTTLTVGSNSVLTINPGVVIKMCQSSIIVNKGLMAVSNSSDPDSQIVFTSYRDDFYGGDTNNDGDASVPVPDDWRRISFEDVSIDPLCHLKNCVFRYGYASYDYGLVTTTNASPMIEHCLFADANTGIRANGASNPVIHNCDLVRLTGYGVNNVGASFNINAENNWWGSNTGPTHAGNPGGTGVPVSDNVDYQPFLTNNSNNPRLGDVSLNSTITAYDAALILLWIVDPVGNPLNAMQLQVADVTGAGGVTSLDASYILQYVAGLIDFFPAETTSEPPDHRPRRALPRLDATNALLSLGDVSGTVGDEIRIPLSVQADGEVWSGFARVTLPSGCEFTAFESDENVQTAAALREGTLYLAFASVNSLPKKAPVAYLRVKITGAPRDGSAQFAWSQVTVNEGVMAQGEGGHVTVVGLPTQYALRPNYPNPFNPNTTIPFELPEAGHVQMIVYDLLGRQVAELENRDFTAGRHVARWNGRNAAGENVASGVYVVRLNAGHFRAVRKLQLVR